MRFRFDARIDCVPDEDAYFMRVAREVLPRRASVFRQKNKSEYHPLHCEQRGRKTSVS